MNTKPNPFVALINSIGEISLLGDIPSFLDPKFGAFLDACNVLQQCSLTHHLQTLLAPDPDRTHDPRDGKPPATFIAGTYLKTLNLMERRKSRFDRIADGYSRKPSAAESFQLNTASQFLLTKLSRGEKPARDVIKTASSVGISKRTLDRAKAQLGVLSIQRTISSSQLRCWVWALPQQSDKTLDSTP